IQFAAENSFIEHFSERKFPDLKKQVIEISNVFHDPDTKKHLSGFHKKAIGTFHDYTHTGHRAVARRQYGSGGRPGYDPEEVRGALDLHYKFCLAAALSKSDLIGNSLLSQTIQSHLEE